MYRAVICDIGYVCKRAQEAGRGVELHGADSELAVSREAGKHAQNKRVYIAMVTTR